MCRTKWLIGTTTMYKLDVHLLQILNTWGKATISLWSLNYSSWIKTLHCVEICCRFQGSTNINLLSCTFSVGFPDRLCSVIQKPFFLFWQYKDFVPKSSQNTAKKYVNCYIPKISGTGFCVINKCVYVLKFWDKYPQIA